MKRRLIFNADDYGLSPGVCAGIRRAHRGVVHSTTVLANLVTAADAAALMQSGMSTGLHLNLSCGPPLSTGYPAALLRPDGWFDKAPALREATWDAADNRAAAITEWQAQLRRFNELGLTPDHLDSHHHTHLLAPLFEPALSLALAENLALRVRPPQVDRARRAGVAVPDAFIEGYFGYNQTSREWLLELLDGVSGAVVEVMCHPGCVDAGLEQISSYRVEREGELAVLGAATLAAELEVLGWQICDYRALKA